MPRFEYDPISLQRDLGRPDAAFFDDEMKRLALEAIDHYAVQIEQPIILHSDWTLDDTLTGFADRIAATLTSRETWRTYAIEAEVFARFLMARHGRRLADLREADLWEYRNRRLYGPLSERLSPNSWNKVAAVILRMLRHLKIHFSEVTWRSYCGTREADDQVKMVSLENYVTFRETGMMSGRNNLRNGAFSEMLVTTGIRCNEGSHILRQEIPKIGLFQDDITRIWSIPATVTKWEKGRDTFISKKVIKNFINPYIYEERSHVAAKIISERFPLKSYSPRTLTMSNNSIFFNFVGQALQKLSLETRGRLKCRSQTSLCVSASVLSRFVQLANQIVSRLSTSGRSGFPRLEHAFRIPLGVQRSPQPLHDPALKNRSVSTSPLTSCGTRSLSTCSASC